MPRVSIVVLGQGVTKSSYPLFRKAARARHVFQSRGSPAGLRIVLQRMSARAKQHPVPFGHWYIDGGSPNAVPPGLQTLAYRQLDPIRDAVVSKLRGLLVAGAARKPAGAR
jgi:hypothetical protein